MDTNELILRVAEALEKQMAFPQWDTIIQIFSVVAAWITILFLLIERKNKERPYLQVSFELVRSSLACLVIRNVGECPLEVSSIKLSEEFVKQLPQKTQERVASLEKSEINETQGVRPTHLTLGADAYLSLLLLCHFTFS